MLRLGLILAGVVILLDQATKAWILSIFRPEGVEHAPFFAGRVIEVLPILDIVLVWNRGVSFGLFNEQSPYNAIVLSVLALLVVAGLVAWLWRVRQAALAVALGLIIGGAIGNVIDRLRFGAVVDFIYFHLGDYYWPAFNVADSAITIGAVILIADALFGGRKSNKK